MDSDFYTEFENNFRGSREQIINLLSNYDGLIDYILNIDNNPSLLDIGSGRGEWIQKCNALGFKSIGLELDPKMVDDCKKLNLNIKEGDALSLLDEFSEDSFSIVSAFHVIEHMNHENIQALLVKSKRVLKPNGLLILETPSIDNLVVSSKSFHIDPTHINPIHPDLLAFMMKRIGFNKQKYYFINGGPLQNSEADSLTRVFNGVAQDLVLIATKSNFLEDSIFNDFSLIKRDMRLGITLLDSATEFDDYTRNRYAQYEEAIFIMRKRIIDLERKLIDLHRKLKYFISFYDFSALIIKKIYKKFKKIICGLNLLFKVFLKSFLRYFYKSKLYLFIIKRKYRSQLIFFIIRSLQNLFNKLGFRIYQNQFVRKSKIIKEDKKMVENYDLYLENFFNTSQDANDIFNEMNKH